MIFSTVPAATLNSLDFHDNGTPTPEGRPGFTGAVWGVRTLGLLWEARAFPPGGKVTVKPGTCSQQGRLRLWDRGLRNATVVCDCGVAGKAAGAEAAGSV